MADGKTDRKTAGVVSQESPPSDGHQEMKTSIFGAVLNWQIIKENTDRKWMKIIRYHTLQAS